MLFLIVCCFYLNYQSKTRLPQHRCGAIDDENRGIQEV